MIRAGSPTRGGNANQATIHLQAQQPGLADVKRATPWDQPVRVLKYRVTRATPERRPLTPHRLHAFDGRHFTDRYARVTGRSLRVPNRPRFTGKLRVAVEVS